MKRTLFLSLTVILLTAFSIFYFVFYQPNRVVNKASAEDEQNEKTEISESNVQNCHSI